MADKLTQAKASFFNTGPSYPSKIYGNNLGMPWSTGVDKLSFADHDIYQSIIRDCRFFYRLEPLAFTVINKMVELAINDIVITPSKSATKTERQIYDALKKDITKFLRKAATEYLTTGLVVPEITLTRIRTNELRLRKIQRIDSLMYPTDMWIRNASDIEIKKPFITGKESYFLIIPEEVIYFIQTGGEYPDGTTDKELYYHILRHYQQFVLAVRAGETEVLLDNPLIVKARELTDSQYPIPYLNAALESFKHKRNVKRMDYSIAARVISAILQVAVGSDEYPLTEDQGDYLNDLETQFKWRENLTADEVERVFTLFTNHTVDIRWIFPDVQALLAERKYEPINKDITVALGFPRILITGETEKSFTSDPEIATLSPLGTMESMRDSLLPIAEFIVYGMIKYNDTMERLPEDVKFKPINLMSLQLFYEGLQKLYESGNLSRQSYDEAFGYSFDEEVERRIDEEQMIKDSGIPEFAPVPHSNVPTNAPNKPNNNTNKE